MQNEASLYFQTIFSQVDESFSNEVMQSLSLREYVDHSNHNSVAKQDESEATVDLPCPPPRGQRLEKYNRGRNSTKEPDSGISSAISSTTRSWSQNDTAIETEQVHI